MAERERRHEGLRAGAPIAVGAVRIIPIERIEVDATQGRYGVWCSAAKAPYAVVIRDDERVWAVGVEAQAVSVARLRAEVPGLDQLLGA